jgi:hypothetical protein
MHSSGGGVDALRSTRDLHYAACQTGWAMCCCTQALACSCGCALMKQQSTESFARTTHVTPNPCIPYRQPPSHPCSLVDTAGITSAAIDAHHKIMTDTER